MIDCTKNVVLGEDMSNCSSVIDINESLLFSIRPYMLCYPLNTQHSTRGDSPLLHLSHI